MLRQYRIMGADPQREGESKLAKYIGPKCKLCRRAGEKLFLKGERCNSQNCAIVKRNYPPGFHGPKGKGRLTDYGQQLNEKQKAKRQYNLLEKQFRLIFEKAKGKTGNTAETFIQLLETRLDNVIYRAGYATSRNQARQLVNHGLFTVNDRKADIPSFQLKSGDVVKIKSNKKNAKVFKDLKDKLKKAQVPGWINLNSEDLSIKVLHKPDVNAMQNNFNVQMIVEFYSR